MFVMMVTVLATNWNNVIWNKVHTSSSLRGSSQEQAVNSE